jgi:pyrroloquinoline-quinone synthase
MNNIKLLKEVDEIIKEYSMLKHPFYQKWNEGQLTLDDLSEYAKQYYAHVKAFPTYLSSVHSRCEDQGVRTLLLDNLIEEEHGPENHPELWLRFAEGIGVDRESVKSANLFPETVESINVFKELTQNDDYLVGVTALYAYESQIPEVAQKKREGLAKFYGITDERAISYFKVHEEADIEHSRDEREIITNHLTENTDTSKILNSAEAASKAVWKLLDGLCQN